MSRPSHLVALAGQPNCGKSTVFNMLTGARQYVANYPGVTVEKRSGRTRAGGYDVELVDLPGIYSLTSYSPEERVTRDFLLHDRPRAVLAVIDAANLRRGLYLTLQLLEMQLPVVVDLNMTDVAGRRGRPVDAARLAAELGVPVVSSVGKRGQGAQDIRNALGQIIETGNEARPGRSLLTYGALEPAIERLEETLGEDVLLRVAHAPRWMAVKLLEGDAGVAELLDRQHASPAGVRALAEALRADFEAATGLSPARHVAFARNQAASDLAERVCVRPKAKAGRADMQTGAQAGAASPTMSERLDRVALHRVFGPLLLAFVLLALYQVAIGIGDGLGEDLRGALVAVEDWVGLLLPAPGFLEDPLLRSLGLWTVQGVTSILGYLPVFLLLFSFIAILEDSGYMPRMAFLLDRLFRRFGLHGQSTLPLILGGVYLGGCSIPAIVSARGIADERARLTTILIAPMMNCLAKVPLYLILVGAYFAENQGLALFFISTITLFMALPVAKAISITALGGRPRAPFLMELPPYHLPTLGGVARRAAERSLLFVKKIMGIVLAVSVVVFSLISFPGLDAERKARFVDAGETAVGTFLQQAHAVPGLEGLDRAGALELLDFAAEWRAARREAADAAGGVGEAQAEAAVDAEFAARNPRWLALAAGQDAATIGAAQALRDLAATRQQLRSQLREEAFAGSFLGMAGRALEPVTRAAGFNWRINIALLSAFAAKENAAASLGAIYGLEGSLEDEEPAQDELAREGRVMPSAVALAASAQEREAQNAPERGVEAGMRAVEAGFTPLSALSLMLFMALYPPCLAAAMTVRLAAGSTRWMLFSIGYQTLLGLTVSSLVHTGGRLLGLTGWQAMWSFYGLCVAATIVMGLVPEDGWRRRNVPSDAAVLAQASAGPLRQ